MNADEQILPGLDIVDLREFATRAGLTYGTIRSYRALNKLPPPTAMLGTKPYWTGKTVEDWIESRVLRVEKIK